MRHDLTVIPPSGQLFTILNPDVPNAQVALFYLHSFPPSSSRKMHSAILTVSLKRAPETCPAKRIDIPDDPLHLHIRLRDHCTAKLFVKALSRMPEVTITLCKSA
jgi:hypothetical protein